jgi:hypothetical protein
MIRLAIVVAAAFATGCPSRAHIQCEDGADCNVGPAGSCDVFAPTGERWCSYGAAECQSGRRWGNASTGDDLPGDCVEVPVDAGVDAEPADAALADAGFDAPIATRAEAVMAFVAVSCEWQAACEDLDYETCVAGLYDNLCATDCGRLFQKQTQLALCLYDHDVQRWPCKGSSPESCRDVFKEP